MRHIVLKFLFLCHKTHFPLLGKDKFPLGVEYIFESKFPLVVRIGLAARACGSGNGQSPSNSVINWFNPLVPDRTLKYVFSEKSFRHFFSHNSSISYAILKIQKAATPQDPRASFW